jgi:hypothetical protein
MKIFKPFVALVDLLSGRTIVRRKNLPVMLDYLRAYLSERGFKHIEKITPSIGMIFLEEALRRAGEKENDGQPRSNWFLKEIDSIADSIIAASNGAADVDPRIKKILTFHSVLPE